MEKHHAIRRQGGVFAQRGRRVRRVSKVCLVLGWSSERLALADTIRNRIILFPTKTAAVQYASFVEQITDKS